MKLNVYLLNSKVTKFKDAIRKSYLTGENSYETLPLEETLPFESVAYIQRKKTSSPSWVDYLSGHFDFGSTKPSNTYNSVILLLNINGRFFAIPFGYGYCALKRDCIERNFGLKTALNALGEDGLKTVFTRTIDLVTQQRRTRMNAPTGIEGFGIDEYVDWVKSIEGKLSYGPLLDDNEATMLNGVTNLAGSDSLRIGCNWELTKLGDGCEDLLKTYNSDAYKDKFSFIDHLTPLLAADEILKTLNLKLAECLKLKDTQKVALAAPDYDIDYSRVNHFHVYKGHISIQLPELTLQKVYEFIEANKLTTVEPQKINILARDDNQNPISQKRSLYDYIVSEIELEDTTYILSLGQWYEVDSSYLKEVERKIQNIPDVTHELDLPPIMPGESEGHYNDRVATEKGWLVLDKKNVYFDSHLEKVEVCDILAPEHNFICVKKMTKSATLSHLFAQGSVSASLMKEERYLTEINTMLEGSVFEGTKYTTNTVSDVKIIYAMPTTKPGNIADCIFFFSRINLLSHIDIIRRVGLTAAICKIEYEQ